MPRSWAAAAAIVVVALGGMPALAQEASPSASVEIPAADVAMPPGGGTLTVEVTDLIGMEGLELAGGIDRVLDDAGITRENVADLLQVPIEGQRFAASDSIYLGPGRYGLVVFAGEPPCEVIWGPRCGEGSDPWPMPAYVCWVDFDLRSGEDIRLRISGLPAFDPQSDAAVGCPMSDVLHGMVTPSTDG